MRETYEEEAMRLASLMRQGAAVITWDAPKSATGIGGAWADRQYDSALGWSERRV